MLTAASCPDPILQAALDRIDREFNTPRDPVAETVRLARKYWREAWKLDAGRPVGNDQGGTAHQREGAAADWSHRLRAKALDLIEVARDMRRQTIRRAA